MSDRLGLPDLPTPHRVRATLPGLYEADALAEVFAGAFDRMLAPVQSTLDCLTAYVDAGQAPDDFLDWVGSWVNAPLDGPLPLGRRRRVVAETARLQRTRGTARGLVALLQVTLGARDVEVEGGGGTWWSSEPGAPVPDEMAPLVVRLTLPRGEHASAGRVERLVATAVPAHLPFRVEVRGDGAVPELRPRKPA